MLSWVETPPDFTASSLPTSCFQHLCWLTPDSHALASREVCCVAGVPPKEAKVTQLPREPWLRSMAPDRTLKQPAVPGA